MPPVTAPVLEFYDFVDITQQRSYSFCMRRIKRQPHVTDAEVTHKQKPAIVAAVISADSIEPTNKQLPITALAGTGKGLWDKRGTAVAAKLRGEWNR